MPNSIGSTEPAVGTDETAMPEISLFSGEFRDPQLERSFQGDNWQGRIFQLRLVAVPAAIFFVIGGAVDYMVVGAGPVLRAIMLGRIGVAAAIIAMVMFAGRLRDRPGLLDPVISGPILLVSLVTCGIVGAIKGELLLHALTALVLVLVYYLFVPVRLAYALLLSLTFSFLFTFAVVLYLEPRPEELIQVVLYLTLVNIFGSLLSRERHAIRRRGFAMIQGERRAVEELRTEISTRTAAERALSESEGRFRSLVELSPDAIVVHQEGVILYINPIGVSLMGAESATDLVGHNMVEFLMPQFRDPAMARAGRLLSNGSNLHTAEIVVRTLDNREMSCEVRSSAIIFEEEPAVQSVVRDITEHTRLREELTRLATTDPLTGICNRRLFFDKLEEELSRARRHSRKLSILLLDLDHFKQVNDRFGHAVGDVLLKSLAAATQELLRSEDLLARLGGEEFGVLLPEIEEEGAAALAGRIKESLAKVEVKAADGIARCTVSIGVAECRPVKESPEAALKRADDAMYRAKADGRDQVRVG